MKAILQSNIICVNNDECSSLILKYRNDSNAFNFDYENAPEDFYQQIRISGYLSTSKPVVKEKIYRRHNGTFKNTGVTIDKKQEFLSDQYEEFVREALVVASRHSEFSINDVEFSAQGEPDIQDNEFNNLATVKLEIFEQGFNQGNVSC